MTEKDINHAVSDVPNGSRLSTTYKFRNSTGTTLYVTITFDEFYVIEGIIINQGASGTSMHNVCNALGRVTSVAIQFILKHKPEVLEKFLEKIAGNLEGYSSEVLWMSDDLGNANSIPDVLARILRRHIEVSESLENMHSGEEEEDAEDACDCVEGRLV